MATKKAAAMPPVGQVSDKKKAIETAMEQIERTYGKATMRTRLEGGSVPTLTKEDFRLAGSDREFAGMMAKKPNKMGFTL